MAATPDLTDREMAVLIGIAGGETRLAIGGRLHLSRTVVDRDARAIRRQLKAKTDEHAVAIACLSGLITEEMVSLP